MHVAIEEPDREVGIYTIRLLQSLYSVALEEDITFQQNMEKWAILQIHCVTMLNECWMNVPA